MSKKKNKKERFPLYQKKINKLELLSDEEFMASYKKNQFMYDGLSGICVTCIVVGLILMFLLMSGQL